MLLTIAARLGPSLCLATVVMMLPAAVFAQPSTPAAGLERPTARAVYVTEPPRIDGVLDEPMWSAIEPVSAFTKGQPDEGAEPSERTEVRIAFNDRFLYFGITFHDSEPCAIRRTILQREGRFDQDDRFVLGLDTYFDHRNAYIFDMNPFGAQGDALVTDEGQPDWNWEGVYWTEARVTEAGWIAEVAIPFTTLPGRRRVRHGRRVLSPDSAETRRGHVAGHRVEVPPADLPGLAVRASDRIP